MCVLWIFEKFHKNIISAITSISGNLWATVEDKTSGYIKRRLVLSGRCRSCLFQEMKVVRECLFCYVCVVASIKFLVFYLIFLFFRSIQTHTHIQYNIGDDVHNRRRHNNRKASFLGPISLYSNLWQQKNY